MEKTGRRYSYISREEPLAKLDHMLKNFLQRWDLKGLPSMREKQIFCLFKKYLNSKNVFSKNIKNYKKA